MTDTTKQIEQERAPVAADAIRVASRLQSFADRLCNDTSLGEKYEGDEGELRTAINMLRHFARATPVSPEKPSKAIIEHMARQSFNERFERDSHIGWKPVDYWCAAYERAAYEHDNVAPAKPQSDLHSFDTIRKAFDAEHDNFPDEGSRHGALNFYGWGWQAALKAALGHAAAELVAAAQSEPCNHQPYDDCDKPKCDFDLHVPASVSASAPSPQGDNSVGAQVAREPAIGAPDPRAVFEQHCEVGGYPSDDAEMQDLLWTFFQHGVGVFGRDYSTGEFVNSADTAPVPAPATVPSGAEILDSLLTDAEKVLHGVIGKLQSKLIDMQISRANWKKIAEAEAEARIAAPATVPSEAVRHVTSKIKQDIRNAVEMFAAPATVDRDAVLAEAVEAASAITCLKRDPENQEKSIYRNCMEVKVDILEALVALKGKAAPQAAVPEGWVHVGTLAVYEDKEATFGHAYDISTNMAGHKALQAMDGYDLFAAPAAVPQGVDRDAIIEQCAKIAADFGPDRPIVSERPSDLIIGRWEGENAASVNIAKAIRTLKGNAAPATLDRDAIIEQCAKACEAENLGAVDNPIDRGYNVATNDCAKVIRALKAAPSSARDGAQGVDARKGGA